MAVHAQESEDYATRLRFLFRNADAAIEDLTVKYSVTVTPFTPLDHIPTKDTFSFTLMRNPSPPTLRLDVDRYDSQKKIHFKTIKTWDGKMSVNLFLESQTALIDSLPREIAAEFLPLQYLFSTANADPGGTTWSSYMETAKVLGTSESGGSRVVVMREADSKYKMRFVTDKDMSRVQRIEICLDDSLWEVFEFGDFRPLGTDLTLPYATKLWFFDRTKKIANFDSRLATQLQELAVESYVVNKTPPAGIFRQDIPEGFRVADLVVGMEYTKGDPLSISGLDSILTSTVSALGSNSFIHSIPSASIEATGPASVGQASRAIKSASSEQWNLSIAIVAILLVLAAMAAFLWRGTLLRKRSGLIVVGVSALLGQGSVVSASDELTEDMRSCGPVALCVVGRCCGKKVSPEEAVALLQTSNKRTKIENFAPALESMGLHASLEKLSVEQLGNLGEVAIVPVVTCQPHYAILAGGNGKYIYIIDPYFRTGWMDAKVYLTRYNWPGYALVVSTSSRPSPNSLENIGWVRIFRFTGYGIIVLALMLFVFRAYRQRRRAIGGAALLLAIALNTGAVAVETPSVVPDGPVAFAAKHLDLDPVPAGAIAAGRIKLSNSGKRDAKILKTLVSCGCLTVKPEQDTIPANGSIFVKIEIIDIFAETRHESAVVITDAADAPLRLEIGASFVHGIRAVPARVLWQVEPGAPQQEDLAAVVSLIVGKDRVLDAKVAAVESSVEWLSIQEAPLADAKSVDSENIYGAPLKCYRLVAHRGKMPAGEAYAHAAFTINENRDNKMYSYKLRVQIAISEVNPVRIRPAFVLLRNVGTPRQLEFVNPTGKAQVREIIGTKNVSARWLPSEKASIPNQGTIEVVQLRKVETAAEELIEIRLKGDEKPLVVKVAVTP
jgi:predicted double-glycine peptidase